MDWRGRRNRALRWIPMLALVPPHPLQQAALPSSSLWLPGLRIFPSQWSPCPASHRSPSCYHSPPGFPDLLLLGQGRCIEPLGQALPSLLDPLWSQLLNIYQHTDAFPSGQPTQRPCVSCVTAGKSLDQMWAGAGGAEIRIGCPSLGLGQRTCPLLLPVGE
jgi:hypothetical protein